MRKMKINGNDYTVGERQFILYQFLRKNSRKGKVATKKMIKDHLLLTYDIEITDNTLYHDIAVLCGDVMGLQIEYDESKRGYWVKNPEFLPNELSLMVDSIQASKFITKRKADEITRKIRNLADTETASALNRTAVVPNRVRSMNESVVNDADRIYRAIEEDRQIGFLSELLRGHFGAGRNLCGKCAENSPSVQERGAFLNNISISKNAKTRTFHKENVRVKKKKPRNLSVSRFLARSKGFEPLTFWSVARHSIQLS